MVCAFILIRDANAKSYFVAIQNGQILCQKGDCSKRFSPCSTFKIAISLMGYDAGILTDEMHPTWDFKPEYVDWLERWRHPHNPTLWMRNSCVWYSQMITQKLGTARFGDYVKKFAYGNEDVRGDLDQSPGLTNSWLFSSLRISPIEQAAFLEKPIQRSLPVSAKAHAMTQAILFLKDWSNGWKLYGKTGGGRPPKNQSMQIGWFIGFLQKGPKHIVFAYVLKDDTPQKTHASLRAKTAAQKELVHILKRVV